MGNDEKQCWLGYQPEGGDAIHDAPRPKRVGPALTISPFWYGARDRIFPDRTLRQDGWF